jgi:ATP-dependent helicase/nuclease subunit A
VSGPHRAEPLQDDQRRAVEPDRTVWLSASAGTGKTHVLTSRVLRLLLQPGVEPSQILCLTFTKAGATEMAGRINERLARWVRLADAELFHELEAIGADSGPEARARARTLFAAVLDCPGGGLRIDTIHAFAQWLLAAFPFEAGLAPGTRPIEDRERALLQRQVLADLVVEAERSPLGDPQLLDALATLSLRLGPAAVEAWLMACAQAHEAWFGPGAWQEPMRPHVERLLGLPAGMEESQLALLCTDEAFALTALRECLRINRAWPAKTGQDAAQAIADWIARDATGRLADLDGLFAVFHTKAGQPRACTAQQKIDAAYPAYVEQVAASLLAIRDLRTLLDLAERLVPAFRLGRAFALAWDAAKAREGLIDFDDQIRAAAALLGDSPAAQWIAYKLDRRFDHILVDEAQDTNAAQWRIIDALTQDFFAGLGQRGERTRTLFVVGDYKQAIFGFQGTSPENFRQASERVDEQMRGAARNAARQRAATTVQAGLDRPILVRSFRTSQPVLDFVDRVLEGLGPERLGLDRAAEPHAGDANRPGYVALWRAVGAASPDGSDEADEIEEGAPEWLSRPEREMAERIARQVRVWMDEGFLLHKGGTRRAGPGDIMVLVRKRRELASLIVARLHAHGLPVAGVDRLRLGAPLAVKDLISALRFAAQPLDDLALAELLVSPLIGWNQEQLLDHGFRPKGEHLWDHLRRASHPEVAAVLDRLGGLLALADFEPPQALLHWLLSGPWQGRRRLVARLGHEANDPIDELVNAAHAFAVSATPSLSGFLAWFEAGDGELKREADSAEGLIRVMTVHGAKGLQAPIVILADATGNPTSNSAEPVSLADPFDDGRLLPLPGITRQETVGVIAAARAREALAADQEHWRLFYVAMTRAEEALFIGGALGKRDKEPPGGSWYAAVQGLATTEDWVTNDPVWGSRLEWGAPPLPAPRPAGQRDDAPASAVPAWLLEPAAEEAKPPRPLAPSALGEDAAPDPPHPPGTGGEAARRGVVIHRLLERLPEVPEAAREAAGAAWLARLAAEFDADERAAMLAQALAVLALPDWAELFGADALAEVPIAALVGEQVVAGTIDRLIVGPDMVRFLDYKTTRRPPAGLGEVAPAHLRQMAAYAAALEAVYPGRRVEAALLFTHAPRLIALPEAVLAPLKQALQGTQ